MVRAKSENDAVTVKRVLTQFAKSILFFGHRTAMGFALAVRECSPLAEEDGLLLGESFARFLEGPLSALADQGSIAVKVFNSGDPKALQVWLRACLTELANSPPKLVADAVSVCFGDHYDSELSVSCVETCAASVREFVEFAEGTIRIFDKRSQLARDAKAEEVRAIRESQKTEAQNGGFRIGCQATFVAIVTLIFVAANLPRDSGQERFGCVIGIAALLAIGCYCYSNIKE